MAHSRSAMGADGPARPYGRAGFMRQLTEAKVRWSIAAVNSGHRR